MRQQYLFICCYLTFHILGNFPVINLNFHLNLINRVAHYVLFEYLLQFYSQKLFLNNFFIQNFFTQ